MKNELTTEVWLKFTETGQLENREELLEVINFFHEVNYLSDEGYLKVCQMLEDPLLLQKIITLGVKQCLI